MLGGRGIRLPVALGAAFLCLGVGTSTASVQTAGGIKYVGKNFNVDGFEKLSVKCPPGTHVIGGGQSNPASYQQVYTYHSFPADDGDKGRTPDDAWQVDLMASNPYTVRAFAICADLAVKYRTEKFTTPAFLVQSEELEVPCPGGRDIIGGGLDAPRRAGENSSYPKASDSWAAYVDSFRNGQKETKVTAICGKPNTTLATMSDTLPANSQQLLQADCPGGKHLYGGGQSNSGGVSAIGLNGGFPFAIGAGAPDDRWVTFLDNNSGGPLSGTSLAVCSPSIN